MSEPRVCFICGKPNPRASRVCADCAASYDMERPFAPDEPVGAPLILQSEETAPQTGRVPLPPQLRPAVEAAPAVVEAPPAATREQEAASRVEEKTEPVATTVRCLSCQEETDPAFSFCTRCGADLPRAGAAPRRAQSGSAGVRAAELPQGVRDTRAAMRRIAEAYRQQESAGQTRTGVGAQTATATGTQAQATLEERREVNPTVNAILSFLFPGVGQLLNGQSGKGIFLILAGFLSVSLMGVPAFGIGIIVARVLVAVDAYRIGERRRKGEKIEPGEWDFS